MADEKADDGAGGGGHVEAIKGHVSRHYETGKRKIIEAAGVVKGHATERYNFSKALVREKGVELVRGDRRKVKKYFAFFDVINASVIIGASVVSLFLDDEVQVSSLLGHGLIIFYGVLLLMLEVVSFNNERSLRRMCTWLYTLYGRPVFLVFIAFNTVVVLYSEGGGGTSGTGTVHHAYYGMWITFAVTLLNALFQGLIISNHPAFAALASAQEEAINGDSTTAFHKLGFHDPEKEAFSYGNLPAVSVQMAGKEGVKKVLLNNAGQVTMAVLELTFGHPVTKGGYLTGPDGLVIPLSDDRKQTNMSHWGFNDAVYTFQPYEEEKKAAGTTETFM